MLTYFHDINLLLLSQIVMITLRLKKIIINQITDYQIKLITCNYFSS